VKFYYLLPVLLCVGCSSTGIIPMDTGSYMISSRNIKPPYTEPSDEKAQVYLEANQFCASQGKSVETLKLNTVSAGFIRGASAELEFRCVPSAATNKKAESLPVESKEK
jgi:hypothetical protein